MEPKITIPEQEVVFKPLNEIKEKKRKFHRSTAVIRKKYAFEDKNM